MQVSPADNVKTSLFYINDVHAQIPKLERIASASLQFDTSEDRNCDKLKVASGDIFLGSDEARNEAVAKSLKTIKLDAKALGNHPFDSFVTKISGYIKDIPTKFLGMNLNLPENSALKDKLMRSTIIEKNGNQYGLIGIQPVDLNSRIKKKENLEGITVDDKEETFKELREEVKQLQDKGVNKIILLSHAGNEIEKEIAQSIDGIDIIFGGHSHDLIKGIKEGENLFYSSDGSPVIITQAGKDGEHFGILNVEFSPEGKIVKAQNNVYDTENFPRNEFMRIQDDELMGETEDIGVLRSQDLPEDNMLFENPLACFVADSMKNELGAEIAFVNAANCRGSLKPGKITNKEITSVFPFPNKLYKVALSEKNLVAALDQCAKSVLAKNHKPGLMQVSGLEYTISKDGELKSVNYIDANNQKHPIDVKNPSETKTYSTVYDDFLYNGGDDMACLKDQPLIEAYDFCKDKTTIDYVKKLNGEPFDLKNQGRIQYV
ncbi:5'-nucleotidase C-terminal domain-containing protein [bacterium]|nr:5'-nucleotidase C-terminal domain-containing protein [bacterium]